MHNTPRLRSASDCLVLVTAEQTLVDQKMTAFGATLSFAARSGEGPFTHPLQTTSIVQCEAAAENHGSQKRCVSGHQTTPFFAKL